ncbi:endo-1,3;1,4-beta-D-glucanase-like isoform X1 [Juglans microcarpa x Juglans regia]|uniref:endo-1,3;1,4-beta-D-glucanase-like isoform X1 n=1 Tax=Juglans microcarpa x Juglans regia TaxID=2249226 RepID=UPI001B7DEE97|nr:endo-1,3;1,4-beta-D-glucanase-like isoform X1 [Juglans microcarpa x Juglans regia]XP_040996070.1 endo-1,3;1,4-beta-D-glucanase-like isoform X1 [Juglans microcarpa x Juglans regia]
MSGPQCCSNPPTLDPSAGSGHVEQLGGLTTYVSSSSDSKLAIILLSDIFGYEAPKLRRLADKVAAAGFYVVVPDFLHGNPFSFENADRPLPVWIKDHGTDKGFEEAKPVIEAVKSKGVSAVGAAGFCWGAKVVVQLAKYELIQAAVILHPYIVTLDDIKGMDSNVNQISKCVIYILMVIVWNSLISAVKVPIAVLGAEIDELAPPELLKQFEQVLSTKPEVDSYVKIFPKVIHGWTTRYDDEDDGAVKSAEEAHQDLLQWFVKYVK